MFWPNGSAAGSNWCVSLYSIGGTLIYTTGSVVGAGNSANQYVTPTAFTLSPGRYYMSMVVDATTANRAYGSTIAAVDGRLMGLLQQASAFTAPTSMTGAQFATTFYPLFGITKTATGY